jgi:hypothetical protein
VHHCRERMAQVVAARLDTMLRSQRPFTIRIDGGGFGGGISIVGFVIIFCLMITRRSFAVSSSSRSDIASRTNEVTIAVNKAACVGVRTKNNTSGKQTHKNQEIVHIRLPFFQHLLIPFFSDFHVLVPYRPRLSGDRTWRGGNRILIFQHRLKPVHR